MGFLRLAGQFNRFGRRRLHPIGQFVSGNPGFQLVVFGARPEMFAIELLDEIQFGALSCITGSWGWVQMQDRRLSVPKLGSLESRRNEPRRPIAFSTRWLFGIVQQHHVPRQVAAFRTETIDRPGPQAGSTAQDAAGVHLANAADVVQTVGGAIADHGDVVDALGDFGIPITDPGSRLAVLLEGALRTEQGCERGAAHRGHRSLKAVRQRLAVEFVESGFRIEQIHVTRTAVEKAPNHRLGLRSEMRLQ